MLCAVAAVGLSEAQLAIVSTDPTLPLLDVPFCAVLSSEGRGNSLFVSSRPSCTTTLATASSGCRTSGWFAFNVTSASVGVDLRAPVVSVPETYWCYRNSGDRGVLVDPLQMNVMQTIPMRYITDELVTMTFNTATPVGSTIAFYYADGECRTPIIGYGKFVLGESRTLQLKIGAANVGVCAMVESTVSGGTNTFMTLRNTLFGGPPVIVTPNYGGRDSVVTINPNSYLIYYCALSRSRTCSDLPNPAIPQVDKTGALILNITQPLGEYYFCVAEGRRLYYAAANMFSVIEYGVRPAFAYAQLPTRVYPSLSAMSNMQVALFSSQSCSGTAVEDWSNFADALWRIQATGTYYACVRQSPSSNGYYANTLLVAPKPAVTTEQSVVVRNFGLSLTFSLSSTEKSSAEFIIRLSNDKECISFYRSASVTDGMTASFAIDENAADTLYWCLSNPITSGTADNGGTKVVAYAFVGSIPVRDFQLNYGPLHINSTVTISLDTVETLPSGVSVAFVPAPRYTCADVTGAAKSAAVMATVTKNNTLTDVIFPSEGQWMMCASLKGSSNPYSRMQSVHVYGDATVWSREIIPQMETAFTIGNLQPLQSVFLTDDMHCSSVANILVSGVTDSNGAVTLTMKKKNIPTVVVCASYRGMQDGTASAAVTKKVAYAASTSTQVFPTVIELYRRKQQLRVVGGGAHTVVNKAVHLTSADIACPLSMTVPNFATVLPALQRGSDADVPVTTLTLNDNMMDTRYRVCVETSNTYEDAGTITITRVSLTATITSKNVSFVAGQLASLTFPADYTSVALVDSFVVVSEIVDCTSDIGSVTMYASGIINASSGAADMFIAPTPPGSTTMNLRVCVAQQSCLLNNTFGYVDGGLLTSNAFTAVSKYALSSLNGGVAGWPVLSYAALYLVKCFGAACGANAASMTCSSAWPQYPVSERTNVTARPSRGTFLLCQSVSTASATRVVGSNSTVEVIDPFSMSFTENLTQLEAFVNFSATVSGGNGESVEVVVQPLSVPCGTTAAESQSFTFIPNVQRTLAVTDIAGSEAIHFCAKPSSQYADAFEVMTTTLVSFVSPTYILFSSTSSASTVTITLAGTVSQQGMLTRERDCNVSILGGSVTDSVDGAFTFTVPPCDANGNLSTVHFCDVSLGVATYRGSLLMLRGDNCSANDGTASIKAVSVVANTPITDFGVNTKYLAVSGISKKADCSSKIQTSVAEAGYMPSVGENAVFYVCTYLVGAPTVAFTTQKATLTVQNYRVTPTAALSPLILINSGIERVLMTLNTPLPPGYTFFSGGVGCANNIGDAPGFNTSAASTVYSHANLCGTVSVCWQGVWTNTSVAVAQFASVTTPHLQSSTVAVVRGASYSATFSSDSCSLDTTTATSSAGERQVYLSADQCASVLDGTGAGLDSLNFTTSVSSSVMTGLSTASLCASTSAGMAIVLAGVPVARGQVYPASLTTGMAEASIFIPSFARTAFWLTARDTSCSATNAQTLAPLGFTTDASGYGTLSIVSANELPLPVGDYFLCYSSTRSAVSLEKISVVAPTFFDVRGTSFVTGVSSKIMMQKDLQTSHLLEGFSTTTDCSALSTAYGSWTRVSDTAIEVTATRPSNSGTYLCARVPLNLSVSALPNAWSIIARNLSFAPSVLVLPPAGFDMCTDYTLQNCTAPNGGGDDQTNRLTVVPGDCCSSSDEANAVGVGSMAGGTCTLHFDDVKVRRQPANTVFSLCAWNTYDASVCATLNYVTVSTNCTVKTTTTTKKPGGVSGGAVARAAIGCLFGALAMVAGVALLCWYHHHQKVEKAAGLKRNVDVYSNGGSFYRGDYDLSAEWSVFLNLPPDGNNCGRSNRLGVSTSAAEMRRDVLAEATGGNDDACSIDSHGAPLDTNFMDDCEELTEKYRNFICGAGPCVDAESIGDFPIETFLRRTKLDTEALCELAKLRSRTSAAGDLSQQWNDRVQRHELFYSMERTNPAAKTFYLFYEEQNCRRDAIEISEDTAFFNIRTLFKSYAAMMKAQHGVLLAPQPSAEDILEGVCSDQNASILSPDMVNEGGRDYLLEKALIATGADLLPVSRQPAEKAEEETPAQARERVWLYRHRRELEFPWVTNNFRTLVGYREDNGEQYNYVDWSLTLLDLQAFHPLHRWWSPLLPRALPPSADDARDPRFAFMHAKSTVPFVRRYFMLFKVEFTERIQIETQEMIGKAAIQMRLRWFANQFGLSEMLEDEPGREGNKARSTGSATAAGGANPLNRDGGVVCDKLKGIDSELSRSDIGVEVVSTGDFSDEDSTVFP
ncbi:hypothetical protein ABB37_03209 [Leptomonas pyrrhocoris]|uniref:Uncharacterized protein n=1 Tax=Leptomonas pyrrhocoris TaxID=157538 RepID=A0A0N1J503_LEPPY|nr:hypothetical protein ABB37_03209 [Leptomonas pyrrhocoris]KPA82041.1 hypothetical protein ABB37_03209 [Leptomonas pyrrhocoris]|eukprot:XP_015660480.1 hypothetical protein ABB37_03209 [Leptomonas pyrrhocoris]